MVFALKEQNRIIGQLRREANANFMLLDDRSRRTQDLVQKLLGKVGRIHVLPVFGMSFGRAASSQVHIASVVPPHASNLHCATIRQRETLSVHIMVCGTNHLFRGVLSKLKLGSPWVWAKSIYQRFPLLLLLWVVFYHKGMDVQPASTLY